MQNLEQKNGLRTWIEINKKSIKHNYQQIKKLLPVKTLYLSVVKSNAYGHGLWDFSLEMERLGADWLGVDSVMEALTLRKKGIKLPILVLGFTLPDMFAKAAEENISLTISSLESLKLLEKAKIGKKIKIHIKVDTGMHRQGFLEEDLPEVLEELGNSKKLTSKIIIQGLYTHLADFENSIHTKNQLKSFEKWISDFKKSGYSPIIHASASGGTLAVKDSRFDMIRIGISGYGHFPSSKMKNEFKNSLNLKPTMSWKTLISETKRVKKSSKIGYDLTEYLKKDSVIAICPIGYWHGFPRGLSSIGSVLVGGKKCKVLGRVSMDMIVIDITGARKLKIGDEVVIIGRQGKEEITAEEVAKLLKTTNYEIITRINPLIKRIYL